MTEAEYEAERLATTPLMRALEGVVNRHSAENGSNTPDFILAQYLNGCLKCIGANIEVLAMSRSSNMGNWKLANSIAVQLDEHVDALPTHLRKRTATLAVYLADSLTVFDAAVRRRESWYGRNPDVGPAGIVRGDGSTDISSVPHHRV